MVVSSKDQKIVVEPDFEKRVGVAPSDVGQRVKRGHSQAVVALCMRIAMARGWEGGGTARQGRLFLIQEPNADHGSKVGTCEAKKM